MINFLTAIGLSLSVIHAVAQFPLAEPGGMASLNTHPTNYPNCVAWWEASDLQLQYNDSVTNWSDAFGATVTQTTSAKQPRFLTNSMAYLNGLPFVKFDGTDDWMMGPSNLVRFQGLQYTFVLVVSQVVNYTMFNMAQSNTYNSEFNLAGAGSIIAPAVCCYNQRNGTAPGGWAYLLYALGPTINDITNRINGVNSTQLYSGAGTQTNPVAIARSFCIGSRCDLGASSWVYAGSIACVGVFRGTQDSANGIPTRDWWSNIEQWIRRRYGFN